MNFKILLLKILMLLDFLICRSRLFHCFIVEGKKSFEKSHALSEVGLSFKKNIWCLARGLVEKDWLLIILNDGFIYQRLC